MANLILSRIWNKAVNTIQRIRNFIRDHDKWIASIGATIILATFVAHDYIREQAQLSKDSIAEAKANLDRVAEKDEIESEENKSAQRSILSDRPASSLPLDEQLKLVVLVHRNLSEIRADLIVLQGWTKLDIEKQYSEEVIQAERDLEALEKTYYGIMSILHGDITRKVTPEEQSNLIRVLSSFWVGEIGLVNRYAELTREMFYQTDEAKKKAEAQLSFWKNASIWLFILGWMISFLGLVCGRKNAGG
jgi:hypothetical protein